MTFITFAISAIIYHALTSDMSVKYWEERGVGGVAKVFLVSLGGLAVLLDAYIIRPVTKKYENWIEFSRKMAIDLAK